jgi:hypothetical protein
MPGIMFQNVAFDASQIAVDAPPPPPVAPPDPIVVGGHIKAPARITYVMPEYPDIARAARVQGVVIIEAIIGADGRVERARAPLEPAARTGGACRGESVGIHADAAERTPDAGHHDRHRAVQVEMKR